MMFIVVIVVVVQVVCYCVELQMVLVVFYVGGDGDIGQLVYCYYFFCWCVELCVWVFGGYGQGIVFVYCDVVVDIGYQQIVCVIWFGEIEGIGQVVGVYEGGIVIFGVGVVQLVVGVVQLELVVVVVVEEVVFQVEVQIVVCGGLLCFEVEMGLFGVQCEVGYIVVCVVYWDG